MGGKCPCLVDETAPFDLYLVASRIVWGKLANCGQNCISPDYLLVHKSKVDALVPELMRALESQFGKDPKQSSLGRVVATGHVDRAIELIEEMEKLAKNDKKVQILCGGSKDCDVKSKYIAPTFILNPPLDSRIMQEEIFSPLLPIIVVESREEAIKIINLALAENPNYLEWLKTKEWDGKLPLVVGKGGTPFIQIPMSP